MAKIDPEAAADIGDRIRYERERLGLSQAALAARVYVTQPAVSQWEKGLTMPTKPMQFALADVLRIDRSRLFAEIVGRAA